MSLRRRPRNREPAFHQRSRNAATGSQKAATALRRSSDPLRSIAVVDIETFGGQAGISAFLIERRSSIVEADACPVSSGLMSRTTPIDTPR